MQAYIYIENGDFIIAKAFGKKGTYCSQILFDTTMIGHERVITDPNNSDKFIIFTAPEIGAVGINGEDRASDKMTVSGIFMRRYNKFPSNFRSIDSLKNFVEKEGKIGIYDIDTEYLTKIVRDNPEIKVVVSTEISNKEELKKYL